ncbi:hypothetical protein ADUPG1_006563 [Aduncisulcus paluster]|uniref:Uncharacterized protein n=1 Tax=Aduncisulcus paluster TaxID=2918883 RepID=A0ABQ5KIP8_9EUKA|nr:hypothetical protein ADUPG1_006563 [Aduncisulcus paluster]
MSIVDISISNFVIPVEPVITNKNPWYCNPIPRDSSNITTPVFPKIEATNICIRKGARGYNQSSDARDMLQGENPDGSFTHIHVPFSHSCPIQGVYIHLKFFHLSDSPPSHLIFTFISSKSEKISKKYDFPDFEDFFWFFLPVALSDVVLCEITGKGRKEECFKIVSLFFIREETHEEVKARVAKEKLWAETPVVKSVFVKEGYGESQGRESIPIPRDDPHLVDPSFSMVKCKNARFSKESEDYDKSSEAQKMLKGECYLQLSHLSIPFASPSPMKGAYICVDGYNSSSSLLFTFTDCDGKKTFKKYEFTEPEHIFEWYFLPIDLCNVVLCEIEGKGMWREKKSRYFEILSLVFTMPEEIIEAERLSLLPWK